MAIYEEQGYIKRMFILALSVGQVKKTPKVA
mgnify:CR=1 FL=1